jgi:hypothetical protein
MWSGIWKRFHMFTIRNWRPGMRAIGPFVLPPILVDAEAFGGDWPCGEVGHDDRNMAGPRDHGPRR